MAPILKSYTNKNCNRSVDAVDALFARNIVKRKKLYALKKTKCLLNIKDLPPLPCNRALLEDSGPLSVNINSTFDRLLREGNVNNVTDSCKKFAQNSTNKRDTLKKNSRRDNYASKNCGNTSNDSHEEIKLKVIMNPSNQTNVSESVDEGSSCSQYDPVSSRTRSKSENSSTVEQPSKYTESQVYDLSKPTDGSSEIVSVNLHKESLNCDFLNNEIERDYCLVSSTPHMLYKRQSVCENTFPSIIKKTDEQLLEESLWHVKDWSLHPPDFKTAKGSRRKKVILNRTNSRTRSCKLKELYVNITKASESLVSEKHTNSSILLKTKDFNEIDPSESGNLAVGDASQINLTASLHDFENFFTSSSASTCFEDSQSSKDLDNETESVKDNLSSPVITRSRSRGDLSLEELVSRAWASAKSDNQKESRTSREEKISACGPFVTIRNKKDNNRRDEALTPFKSISERTNTQGRNFRKLDLELHEISDSEADVMEGGEVLQKETFLDLSEVSWEQKKGSDDFFKGFSKESLELDERAVDITGEKDVQSDNSVGRRIETRMSSSYFGDISSVGCVSNVDHSDVILIKDSFVKPVTRHFIKAGKMWRRSLITYKRNCVISKNCVDLTESTCQVSEGPCGCQQCKENRLPDLSVCRKSIRLVPDISSKKRSERLSLISSYANRTSYAPNNIQGTLEQIFEGLSVSNTETQHLSIEDNSNESAAPFVTAKEIVLRRCGQTEPVPFSECYPQDVLKNCHKIGEGVYGEVFLFRNKTGTTSVMKVIPIEGDLIVNGERQKKFEEILTEIIIAMELSDLRKNQKNSTSGFNEVSSIHCVRGQYPARLLDLWDLYNEDKGSENDCPDVFGPDQLYVILELTNGGKDLESYLFNNAVQAHSLFQQAACSLAVAEVALQFEHRDLHWGNILISGTDKKKKLVYNLSGRQIEVPSNGVQISIIDFTLSRITFDSVCIYNDLGQDPDLFNAEGDYQFEIYRLMQKYNHNEWQHYEPYTNILWLHYTLDKMITSLRYKYPLTNIHNVYIGKLQELKEQILEFKSVEEFVTQTFVF